MNGYRLFALVLLIALAGCDVFVSPAQRVERAAALIAKGDYPAASIELRNALQKEPDNARGRVLLARTEFWSGDLQSAQRDIERAENAGAPAVQTARLDADIKNALGQFEALASFTSGPREGLQEYERLMFLGYAQLGLKQFEAARQSFEASVKAAGPGLPSAEARSAKAAGLAASGDIQGALAVLDGVIADRPDYQPAAIDKARLLAQRGSYADAEKILSALNHSDQWSALRVLQRVSVLNSLTDARLSQRRLNEAQQSLEQLAVLVPDAPIVAYMQGRLAMAQGKPAVAITALQKAVNGAPGLLPAHALLGIAYLGQGNVALAEEEFRRALEIAPDNLEVRKLLAQTQLRQGRPRSAIDVLAPALAADTQDPVLYTLAGQAHLMQGDREVGDSLLEQGLAEAANNPELRLQMAGTYLSAGDSRRALELVATVPDDVGGSTKRQIQLLATVASKDKAAARLEIDELIRKNPDDITLLNLAAAWLAYQGDDAAARAYLSQALVVAPSDARTLVTLGRLEMAARHDAAAVKAFERALASSPRNGDAYFALAVLADRNGDGATAVRRITEWSKADPEASQPRLLLARAAFHDGNLVKAHELIDEAIKLSSNSAPVQGVAGQLLMEAGLYDEALGHFRSALALDARNPAFLLGAARAQVAMDQRGAARESLNGALEIRPNWPPAVILLAQVESRDRHFEAALALADGLKKDQASTADAYLLEGDIRMSAGQPTQAVVAYAQSARVHPSASAAIGESRARRAARLPNAVDPLSAWLERNPDDTAVRLEMAQALQEGGARDDAIREYERVLKVQPDELVALNNLAWLYSDRDDPRAETLARQAVAKAPRSGALADTLGWILYKSGKNEESLKILRQAHDLDRKNAEIAYHYGAALLKAGKNADARQVLVIAVEAGNAAPWVGQARKLLAETG
jgi:putative PEP-CTERM system TPR-repeat lipoprotein